MNGIRDPRTLLAALLGTVLAASLAPASAGARVLVRDVAVARTPASAMLEACQTASVQLERSATFVGEMTAIPGTARMLMRIDVLERAPQESSFHPVVYPGLGTWLRAAPGVKTYKNLDRVTDLSAPADYRGGIRFRWVNARGRTIRTLELLTPRCRQDTAAALEAAAPGGTSA